ncbi:flagellar hook-basal body complex protein [Bartonella sp. TP]|uniref:flagellar hook protein FlgE n=1 Tax=Bartonella sp. TP TaxID=3057550 RepID=UPI0025AFE4D4|nr:flagellar hook-basal body complex protein [Bartonella sp. TP]WJW80262.1 flagellar hook-basal body complex protein [Bartonella sp. TP]
MGIFNMMRTSISGMSAQSDRLGTISDNVANAGTIGYKKAGAQFSDLLHNESFSAHQSGSVQTHVRYDVTVPGSLRSTSDARDLSISGNGFFLVTDKLDGTGEVVLTRAGDFKPDKDGNLRNSAGFYLLKDADNKSVANVGDTSGKILEQAKATTKIKFSGNLPYAGQPELEDSQFSPDNPKTYTQKSTVHTIGLHGENVSVDVYFIKTKSGWTIECPKNNATKNGLNDFNSIQVTVDNKNKVSFKANNNEISADTVTITVGDKTVAFDPTGITLSGQGMALHSEADGQADGAYNGYKVSENGELLVQLTNGHQLKKGFINVATVAATDKLLSASGTVFKKTAESGEFIVGMAANGSFGKIETQQLEQSNVDIATELTDMIEAQRTYTSNSKVFQAGAEMMDAVLNMVR